MTTRDRAFTPPPGGVLDGGLEAPAAGPSAVSPGPQARRAGGVLHGVPTAAGASCDSARPSPSKVIPFRPRPTALGSVLRVLTWRVDALYLAFQGTVAPAARAALEAAQLRADAAKTDAPFEHEAGGGAVQGALSTQSRDGWWVIGSAWVRVVVNERAAKDWTLEVRPSALLLMHEGPRAALDMARGVARALLSDVRAERLRRLDLCCDAVGVGIREIDVEAFVTHHKLVGADIGHRKQFWRAGKRTGFVFGKSDGVARIYDKTEQLRAVLPETGEDERVEWRMAGWNGTDDVTRLEFQLRGRVLDELELRDPQRALERLDAVWAYATKKWLRLVDADRWREERRKPKRLQRKDRMPTSETWEAFQNVVFRAKSDPAKRMRAPATPHARRVVSSIVNYCAAMGALAGHVVNPDAAVANWTDAYAEEWIQEQLFSMASPTLRAARIDLVARFEDAKEAAKHLMTRQGAAALKFTRRRDDNGASVAA